MNKLHKCYPFLLVGLKFDFPILCAECHRNGIELERLAVWSFVDTLDVVKAVGNEMHGGCIKLQCLLRCLAHGEELRAHRVLNLVGKRLFF